MDIQDIQVSEAIQQGLIGTFGPITQPMSDIRFLEVTSEDGINRWGIPVTTDLNDYSPTPSVPDTFMYGNSSVPSNATAHRIIKIMQNQYGIVVLINNDSTNQIGSGIGVLNENSKKKNIQVQ